MPHGQVAEYNEMTQNCVSKRLILHFQKWIIKEHFENKQRCKPIHKLLAENTNVIAIENSRFKLAIKEGLHIKKLNPLINRQFEKFENTPVLQRFKNKRNHCLK